MNKQLPQHTTINHSEKAYIDKVNAFLKNGKPGATYTIDVICEKANQPKFIEIVKAFMRNTLYAGGWEFNSDYTKLCRIDLSFKSKMKSNFYQS